MNGKFLLDTNIIIALFKKESSVIIMRHLMQFLSKPTPWICLVLVVAILGTVSMAKDVAVIRIKHRWAAELAPIVESMLSPDGSVTVSERVNSLVIVDNQDAIRRVRTYLAEFDIPLEQVRIRVRFYEQRSGEAGSATVRGRVSGDDWHASVGGRRKDGADISVEAGRRRRTNFSEHAVIATAGPDRHPGRLMTTVMASGWSRSCCRTPVRAPHWRGG